MEYGSQQEFLRKLRGLSIFVLANMGTQIQGFEGYDLSTAPDPSNIPDNFTRLDRIGTKQFAPMGGFYIANETVTQREYETVMRTNPSVTKNPTQPVNNVSIIDAMIFCNQKSIREGLEPVYLIEGSAISVDSFASGYRLATTEEWNYAFNNTEGKGYFAEYIFDGAFVYGVDGIDHGYKQPRPPNKPYQGGRTMFADNKEGNYGPVITINEGGREPTRRYAIRGYEEEASGQKYSIYPVIRLIRPILDYWKYTSGDETFQPTEFY